MLILGNLDEMDLVSFSLASYTLTVRSQHTKFLSDADSANFNLRKDHLSIDPNKTSLLNLFRSESLLPFHESSNGS